MSSLDDQFQAILARVKAQERAERAGESEEAEEVEEADEAGEEATEEVGEIEEPEEGEESSELSELLKSPESSESSKSSEPSKPSAEKSIKRLESDTIKPTTIKVDIDAVQDVRANRLARLLASKDIDAKNYDLAQIDWSQWSQDEIKEYNNLIYYIQYDQSASEEGKWVGIEKIKVDPYAMAQVDINLWPEVKYHNTTVRQEIKRLLHPRYKIGIDDDRAATYKIIKQNNQYIALPLSTGFAAEEYPVEIDGDNYIITTPEGKIELQIVDRYDESAWSRFDENSKDLISLFKKTTDYYKSIHTKQAQIDFLNWLSRYLENNASTYVPDEVAGSSYGVFKRKESDTYSVLPLNLSRDVMQEWVPVRVSPAKMNPRLSFAPRAKRRQIGADGGNYSKKEMVGGLSNAISHLFDSFNFDPQNENSRIDWETVYKLSAPIDHFLDIAARRGHYMLNWDDAELLNLYRVFTSVLPRPKGDKPTSPNRIEWEKNFRVSDPYPTELGASATTLQDAIDAGLLPNLNVYVYDGPRREKMGDIIITPEDQENYKYYEKVGPLKYGVKSKVIDKLVKINDILAQSVTQLAATNKVPLEGIVTSPATILINGTPFKLCFGDKLIIDNVKKVKSTQK